jgi:lon-related putative ATP-dependent protease
MTSTADAVSPLEASSLRRACDPKGLGFSTTDELPKLAEVIGQPRAFRAMQLGTEVAGPGYNIFVLGLPGSGKTTLIREYLQRKAAKEPVSDDWCYVNNFENPHEPIAIRLPAGKGIELRKDMEALLGRCRQEIMRAFGSKEYTAEVSRLGEEHEKLAEAEFRRLNDLAAEYSFVLARTAVGFALVPAVKGKPLTAAELEKLTPEQREKLKRLEEKLQAEIKDGLSRIRESERALQQKLEDLNRRVAAYAVEHLFDPAERKYAEFPQVVAFLQAVQKDIIEHESLFRQQPEAKPLAGLPQPEPALSDRYEVNVLVDRSGERHAPVVVENQPTYFNLLGRVEHEVVMGATRTNFRMIRAGALHRANGGYLVLPARDVLLNAYAWEGLKRALREECLRIISPGHQLGLISTVTLEPEPIPLEVKVVLIGTPLLYYLLRAYDEDFAKLFKVKAEFATLMDRNEETEREYALFVKAVVEANQLPPFDASAVARVIEYGSRLAEDQGKLSTRFGRVADLIREAAYWAQKEGQKKVGAEAVARAEEEIIFRSNLLEERLQEMVEAGTLLIDVEGEAVGQVNALSVIQPGDYAFGRPTRVTATVHAGQDGVIDIEREAKLGGRIHTKGVLIISGLLGQRYGQKTPLSLSAALTFEQSYEGVEGDSASAAELFALLSAISQMPLRQDVAVTGSVNQHGEIQPVGGINEKIEGFYRACKTKGLTGTQGVIIPQGNVRHLMLEDEVIQAVERGDFHIWPISTIDQGLALLTGKEPGVLDEQGEYPEGTLNRAVVERLKAFAQMVRPETEKRKGPGGEEEEAWEGDEKNTRAGELEFPPLWDCASLLQGVS